MSGPAQGSPPNDPPAVVNWGTPSKRDLVERAVADGMTDPAKIIAWAHSRDVVLTVEEVDSLKKDLGIR